MVPAIATPSNLGYAHHWILIDGKWLNNMDELATLRGKLEALKHLMERYFMGLDKRLPFKERAQISKEIRAFQPTNDSVSRFKHQNLMQRLMTLERYWQRTIKAIDEGRYHRDVFKADFRSQTTYNRASNDRTSLSDSTADADAAAFLAELSPNTQASTSPKVAIRGERKKSVKNAPQIALRGAKRKTEEKPS